jgi:hypothetical protein
VIDSLVESRSTPPGPRVPVSRAFAWRQHRAGTSDRRPILGTLLLLLLCCLAAHAGRAEETAREEMRSLDEQVQEIKSDVLGIAAELTRLEEKLLYPSDTQVAVFVSLAAGESFQLDAVHVSIDGKPVAHHVYTFKELEALRKGGVQRIYTGNAATGEHGLEVSVAGKQPGGDDFEETASFTFRKDVEPALVGLTLSGPGSGTAPIQLGDW